MTDLAEDIVTTSAAEEATGRRPHLVEVDPGTLVLRANYSRVNAKKSLDPDFLASVKEHGVLQAITAYEDGDELVVLMGERRTLAAIDGGRETVPVMVVPRPGTGVQTVVRQVDENARRAGLTAGDRVKATEQLAAFGLAAGDIAKQLRTPKKDVEQALQVARHAAASKIVARYSAVTLDVAAAISELDPRQDRDAIKQISVAAAKGKNVEYEIRQAQKNRQLRDETEKALAALAQAGVTVIDAPADTHGDKRVLSKWASPDGNGLSEKTHCDCPGHAAYLVNDYWRINVVYVCTDPKANKHRKYAYSWLSGSTSPEKQREERREVIANNKAWAIATEVRQDFVKELCRRKTPPQGTVMFLAQALLDDEGHWLREAMEKGDAHALSWLGIKAPTYGRSSDLSKLLAGANDARALMLMLTVVLGAHEKGSEFGTWRSPRAYTVRYLRFLETQGYVLTDVERILVKRAEPKKVRRPRNPVEPQQTDATLGTDEPDQPEADNAPRAAAEPDQAHQ
ncbi:chromosome partitioning protein, ParB family [Asanoa hainanensis]|uniref:Chromosome partitioning protein, ParB family n=1 Tax=Asanoa hainanensis TaxID=560556 RepID=A0A239PFQ7_9ACTN|nr:ParB N-terminal domain-containing protein [Asanoa hainanensis]SNT65665.1 chromosome partitioning protein, ParB family [Asanoa hainanensis]